MTGTPLADLTIGLCLFVAGVLLVLIAYADEG